MAENKLTLRDFFERNVNLFTILGIFNALAIYSSSIDDEFISMFMAFIFSLLSILVLNPIIKDVNDNDEYVDNISTVTSYILKLSLVGAECLLVLYICKKFYELFHLLIFFYIVFLIVVPITKYITVPIIKKFKIDSISRPYTFKFQLLNFIVMLAILITALLLTTLASYILDFLMESPTKQL